MKSKKGLSPLIATILLIAFAIALGAVVMSWGRGYVSEEGQAPQERPQLSPAGCSSAAISWKYGIGEKPCYDTDDFKFAAFIDNGQKELAGIKVVIYGNNGVVNIEKGVLVNKDGDAISAGDSVLVGADYGSDGSSIESVEIIPKVRVEGSSEEAYCTEQKIKLDQIKTSATCYK